MVAGMKASAQNPIWEKVQVPVLCRGVLYKSATECARALGVANATVYGALEAGSIDRCGLRDGRRQRKPKRPVDPPNTPAQRG